MQSQGKQCVLNITQNQVANYNTYFSKIHIPFSARLIL